MVTEVYGEHLELQEVPENYWVADVMVLARVVGIKDGKPDDKLLITPSPSATGMIQQGMVSELNLSLTAPDEE